MKIIQIKHGNYLLSVSLSVMSYLFSEIREYGFIFTRKNIRKIAVNGSSYKIVWNMSMEVVIE